MAAPTKNLQENGVIDYTDSKGISNVRIAYELQKKPCNECKV